MKPDIEGRSKASPFFPSTVLAQMIFLGIFFLFLLLGVGWVGFQTLEKEIKGNLSNHLKGLLISNEMALRLWIKEKKTGVETWANQPVVQTLLRRLITASKKGNIAAKNTPELIQLRKLLEPVCHQFGYIGFVAFDTTGLQVAALLDEPVGQRTLSQRSDFVQRSLLGETVFAPPFEGEVALPTVKGKWEKKFPTMFVSAPVKDKSGKIFAVLSFRLRPETDFSKIMKGGRHWDSDETYAFNKDGFMISQSRFIRQLRESGILKDSLKSTSILKVRLIDRCLASNAGVVPDGPLNRMAQSALKGEFKWDVDGYCDYRGIPVVGAWKWLDDLNFGLVTEIDQVEALKPLNSLRVMFLFILALLGVSLIVLTWLRGRQIKLERSRKVAAEALSQFRKSRESFLINTSHELRTPLTGIRGYSELLLTRRNLQPEEIEDFIQKIHSHSEKLTRAMDDLLQIYKIEAGEIIYFEPQLCEPVSYILEEIQVLKKLYPDQNIIADLPPNSQKYMLDPYILRKVLHYSLENTIQLSQTISSIKVGNSKKEKNLEISISGAIGKLKLNNGKTYQVEDIKSSEIGGFMVSEHLLKKQGGHCTLMGMENGGFQVILSFSFKRPRDES